MHQRASRKVHFAALMHPTDLPLHVGPARLAAKASGANEHPQRAAAFSRQLQAAEIADIERPARGIDRADTGATERLVEGPQLRRLIRRLEKERLR